MTLPRPLHLAAIAVLALALPAHASGKKGACPAGETMSGGKCVKACSTAEPFGAPDDCACPQGYGKILLGNGNGECHRLACPTNSAFEPKQDCECPRNHERKPAGKGQVKCALKKA